MIRRDRSELMRMVVRVLLAVVLFLSAADVALAQRTTATLGGVVTDTAGGVLPGAKPVRLPMRKR